MSLIKPRCHDCFVVISLAWHAVMLLMLQAVDFLTADQTDAATHNASAHGGLADVNDSLAAAAIDKSAIDESPSTTPGGERPTKRKGRVTFTNGDGLELAGTLVDTGSKVLLFLGHCQYSTRLLRRSYQAH